MLNSLAYIALPLGIIAYSGCDGHNGYALSVQGQARLYPARLAVGEPRAQRYADVTGLLGH